MTRITQMTQMRPSRFYPRRPRDPWFRVYSSAARPAVTASACEPAGDFRALNPLKAEPDGGANRRPRSPLQAERPFGRAVHAPPSLSAAVAHLGRSPIV